MKYLHRLEEHCAALLHHCVLQSIITLQLLHHWRVIIVIHEAICMAAIETPNSFVVHNDYVIKPVISVTVITVYQIAFLVMHQAEYVANISIQDKV